MPKITLGSDPEIHLRDNYTGRIVSSIPVLKRDKTNPILLAGKTRLYHDNVLTEIAHEPVESPKEAIVKFKDIFARVQEFLGPRYSLVPTACHVYDKEHLKEKTCWETGCNPNLDAYREMENPKVEFTSGLRTGSFHVHLGHEKLKTMFEKGDFIKLMDIYLGCSSVIFDKDKTARKRRDFYGRAGEFRCCPYGVEFRVLGNYPLRSPELTELVFDLAVYCASHIDGGTVKDVITIKGIQTKAQLAINTMNQEVAEQVLKIAALPHALLSRVNQTYKAPESTEAWK